MKTLTYTGHYGAVAAILALLFHLFSNYCPAHTVYGGPMLWDISDTKEMMTWYHNFISKAPDNVYGFFATLTVPPVAPFPEHLHLKKMCGVVWCYTGDMDKAEEVFKPIRAVKTPALDFVGPIPVPALQTLFDGLYPSRIYYGTGKQIM